MLREAFSMRLSRLISLCVWTLATMALASATQAASLAGQRTMSLVSPSGEKTVIGHVRLTPKDNGYAYEVTYNKAAFTERYMEETNFLCLPGQHGDICQFPYPPGEYSPNDSTGFFKDDDLRPLEYAMLFAERRGNDVDINPFNGIYYRLHVVQEHLEGTLFAADFRLLIGTGNDAKYPLDGSNLDTVDLKDQRYPKIVIEW